MKVHFNVPIAHYFFSYKQEDTRGLSGNKRWCENSHNIIFCRGEVTYYFAYPVYYSASVKVCMRVTRVIVYQVY